MQSGRKISVKVIAAAGLFWPQRAQTQVPKHFAIHNIVMWSFVNTNNTSSCVGRANQHHHSVYDSRSDRYCFKLFTGTCCVTARATICSATPTPVCAAALPPFSHCCPFPTRRPWIVKLICIRLTTSILYQSVESQSTQSHWKKGQHTW